jgi:hypothetical protein
MIGKNYHIKNMPYMEFQANNNFAEDIKKYKRSHESTEIIHNLGNPDLKDLCM